MTNATFAVIAPDELSNVTGGFSWANWFPGFVPGAEHPRNSDPQRLQRFQEGQAAVRRSLFGQSAQPAQSAQ